MESWSKQEVADWITSIGFAQYAAQFLNNDIEGPHLLSLTIDELKNDLSINSLGHRKDIMKQISLASKNTLLHETNPLQPDDSSSSSLNSTQQNLNTINNNANNNNNNNNNNMNTNTTPNLLKKEMSDILMIQSPLPNPEHIVGNNRTVEPGDVALPETPMIISKNDSTSNFGLETIASDTEFALVTNVTTNRDLEREELIAKGSSGTVWRAKYKGQLCAAKIVPIAEGLSAQLIRHVQQEIEILSHLQHSNIVQFLHAEERKESQDFLIVMELLDTSLNQLLRDTRQQARTLNRKTIYFVCRSVARGLSYIHSLAKPILHRDVKSKNILVSYMPDNKFEISLCKLCDFSISKKITDSQLSYTMMGTPRFASPELLNGGGYGTESDIWSYGLVVFEMLSLRAPYFDIVDSTDVNNLIKAAAPPNLPPFINPNDAFVDLMFSCLKKNPKERPKSIEVVNRLEKEELEILTFQNIVSDSQSSDGNEKSNQSKQDESAQPFVPKYESSCAVLIGVTQYKSSQIENFPTSQASLQMMRDCLSKLNFDVISITNEDATKQHITEVLSDPKLSSYQRVIVFFSCRWKKLVGSDDIYLFTHDTSPDQIAETSISIDSFKTIFARTIPVKHLLFVLDTCVSKLSRMQFLPSHSSSLFGIQQDNATMAASTPSTIPTIPTTPNTNLSTSIGTIPLSSSNGDVNSGMMTSSSSSTIHHSHASRMEQMFSNGAVEMIVAGCKGQANHKDKITGATYFVQKFCEAISSSNAFRSKRTNVLSTEQVVSWIQHEVSSLTGHCQFPQYERLFSSHVGSCLFVEKTNINTSQTLQTTMNLSGSSSTDLSLLEFTTPKSSSKEITPPKPISQNSSFSLNLINNNNNNNNNNTTENSVKMNSANNEQTKRKRAASNETMNSPPTPTMKLDQMSILPNQLEFPVTPISNKLDNNNNNNNNRNATTNVKTPTNLNVMDSPPLNVASRTNSTSPKLSNNNVKTPQSQQKPTPVKQNTDKERSFMSRSTSIRSFLQLEKEKEKEKELPLNFVQVLTSTLVHQADSASMLDFSSCVANSVDILMRQIDFFWNELPGTSLASMDLRIDIANSPTEIAKAFKQCVSKRGILHFFDPNLLLPLSKSLLILQESNTKLNSFDESELLPLFNIDSKSGKEELPLVVVIANTPNRLAQFFMSLTPVKSVLLIPTSLAFPFIHDFYSNFFGSQIQEEEKSGAENFHVSLINSFKHAIQLVIPEQRSQIQFLQKENQPPILLQLGHTRISIPRIPISNIALATDSHLLGRNFESFQICRGLTHSRLVFLTGHPGGGKSALARLVASYLNFAQSFPDGVFYVDLKNAVSSSWVASQISTTLGLTSLSTANEQILSSFSKRESLLVLDNVERLLTQPDFRKFLLALVSEKTKYMKVIVVTHHQLNDAALEPVSFSLKLIPVSANVASQILQSRIQKSNSQTQTTQQTQTPTPTQQQQLQTQTQPTLSISFIAERLSAFPFLLQVVSSVLEFLISNVSKQQEFLVRLNQRLNLGTNEQQVIEACLSTVFEELSDELKQFEMCLGIFPSTFDVLATVFVFKSIHHEGALKLLKELESFHLIERGSGGQYYLHSITRMFVFDSISLGSNSLIPKWKKRFLKYYVSLLKGLDNDYKNGKNESLRKFDAERHNIDEALKSAQETNEDLFLALSFAGETIFCARMTPAERIKIYEEVLSLASKTRDFINQSAAQVCLAFALEKIGEFGRAESLYLEALKLREKNLGPSSPLIADVLKSLGVLYTNQNYKQDPKKAGKLMQRALRIREMSLGMNHPDTARMQNIFGNFQRESGSYDAAEDLYTKALVVLSRSEWSNIDVARVLANQGQLFVRLHRMESAEMRFLESIRIQRHLKHPDVTVPLSHLATLYRSTGKPVSAEMLLREALEIRTYRKEDVQCAHLSFSLAKVCIDQGPERYSDAEEYLNSALHIYDAFFGRSHHQYEKAFQALQDLYKRQNKPEKLNLLFRAFSPTKQYARKASENEDLSSPNSNHKKSRK